MERNNKHLTVKGVAFSIYDRMPWWGFMLVVIFLMLVGKFVG
jgi:hypothetical protein